MLCAAKWRALRAEKQNVEKELSQVDRILSPLHVNEGDFFWVDPKKVATFLLDPFALLPTPWAPHPRPLSRKGRRVKDLEGPAAMLDSSLPSSHLRAPPTFFRWSPKKSPFFSAPKKPKKSLTNWLRSSLQRLFGRNTLFSRPADG
jgi:hypothetical protein